MSFLDGTCTCVNPVREIVFELCVESAEACVAANDGGADRIELCSALSEGGLTPSHGLLREALWFSKVPVHTMVRPRGGDFVYSDVEFSIMRTDLIHARELGVGGFVLGILLADGSVDVERMRELVALAAPYEVTFHRAFDDTPELPQALEDVIASGCRRLLTSGGEADVVAGADALATLVKQADGRLQVAVGGGLRIMNAAQLARTTGAMHFHGSLRRRVPGDVQNDDSGKGNPDTFFVDVEDVRAMVQTLRMA